MTQQPGQEVVSGLVSTIIPVFNRPDMVREAADSVLEQRYRPIEMIIVDDGSNQETREALDDLAAAHAGELRVIHQPNGGPGLARETGRRRARGEFIQYLDSDDWLLPNKFDDQVRALRAHPDCDIAYGTSMFVDAEGEVINPVSRWTGRTFEFLFPALLERRWWYTHTPLFTRRISDAAGSWPARRPEDWDLEARMGALKARLVHCGSTVSCQREHEDAGRVSHGNVDAYLRDEAWFLPRLHSCALRAGIANGSAEMRRFSRWAFMRARDLGALGETEAARALLDLTRTSAGGADWSLRLVGLSSRIIGWRMTGRLCRTYLRAASTPAP